MFLSEKWVWLCTFSHGVLRALNVIIHTSKIINENFLSLKVLVPIQLMPEKSSLFQIALVAWVSGNANKAWLDD